MADPMAPTAPTNAALRQLAFLERVARASAERADHAHLLRTIIDEATGATSTQVCSLYLWDDTEKVLVLTATNGLAQSGVGVVRLGLGEGVTGWVAAQRLPLVVPDVRAEPRFTWVPNLDQERFRSMLSVPILTQDRVIGVMNLQTVEIHHFSSEEVEFVQALAAQVAGMIELSALRQKLAGQLALEREAVQRLTALNASKSDLLAMLSHDFRGPLSIARSYAYGLKERLSGPDLEACRELEAELESLERMTDNVMLSLELESQHQLVLDLEEFDLVELVDRTCRGLQRTSDDHTIMFQPGSATCVVSADRSKIRSVVINLIGNALKYSPSGGRIWVRLTPEVDRVEISVEDEGIGLDVRDVESIFERYGRGDTALERGIRGHGLGLFICRQIAESHGGTIYARPLARGSRFTLMLPRRPLAGERGSTAGVLGSGIID
jgi:signal transduction histidine kinase